MSLMESSSSIHWCGTAVKPLLECGSESDAIPDHRGAVVDCDTAAFDLAALAIIYLDLESSVAHLVFR